MKRENCLICNSKNLIKILDLGSHPFADTFINKDEQHNVLPVYNLSCVICDSCKHVQTECITDSTERYNLFDYSYTSSNSNTSRNHWDSFCKSTISMLSLNKDCKICEIGSNDGYLLSQFKTQLGSYILGIDASRSMCDIANKNGITTEWCVFNKKQAVDIVSNYDKYDVVVANNVYNHSDDPVSFTEGVGELLKEGGHFVFEVPYWKNSVDSGKIDQVYHEHVSYFTVTSLIKLLENCNFEIIKAEVVDYHGGSLRVFSRRAKHKDNLSHCDLQNYLDKEKHLFLKHTYDELNKKIVQRKIDFVSDILEYKKNGYNIVAVGAAAKGTTLLNFLNLSNSIIDHVTDISELKQGKRTPLSNINICGDEIIASYDKVCALILSWNLSEPIKQKMRKINSKIKYINFYE